MAVVSIFVDASHCPKTKLAAYAFQVRGSGQPIYGCSDIPGLCESSNTAELSGLYAAVATAREYGLLTDGCKLFVYTDSQFVIDRVWRDKGKNSATQKKLADGIKAMFNTHRLDTRYKHIRGHSRVLGPFTGAMRHCDTLARQRLNLSRGLLRGQ